MSSVYNSHEQLTAFSWARYTVELKPNEEFQYIGQNYLNDQDNDWRSEYVKTTGKYQNNNNHITFKGEKSINESKSFHYSSGQKEGKLLNFTGVIEGDTLSVKFSQDGEGIRLKKSADGKLLALPGLVYPDIDIY